MTLPGAGLIFLLAPLGRSGTNYIEQLLCQHWDVDRAIVGEDYLVSKLSDLNVLLEETAPHWTHPTRPALDPKTMLAHGFGAAIADFLRGRDALDGGAARGAPCIVARTPRTAGLSLLGRFLPGAQPIVVVRDPRDMYFSGKKSFGWTNWRGVAIVWADAMRQVLLHRQHCNLALVRYENVVADPVAAMQKLLVHLGLPLDRYDWNSIGTLPILGSSETVRDGGKPHWRPVERTPDFKPVGRWCGKWTEAQHDAFVDIVREPMEALGYDTTFKD